VAWVVRAVRIAEDGIHLVVAVLLVALALGLIVDTVRQVTVILSGSHQVLGIVPVILDETLLLFIVTELLHTVAVAVRHGGALNPEPFIIIGLVAGVRRLLILTAAADRTFRWNPVGIEMVILIGLILMMAVTLLVWRRAAGPRRSAGPSGGPWAEQVRPKRAAAGAAKTRPLVDRDVGRPPRTLPVIRDEAGSQ
jgi:uncharacterized membrane protein (DUF373 family)